MKLKYKAPRKATARGPYIHMYKGKAYRFDIGASIEVADDVAHDILSKVGDIIEKAPDASKKKKAPAKKKADPAPKNKMMDVVPVDK